MFVPSIGLSMIVKNEAANLRSCLESVRGLVQQIVIADTGSTDNTACVARELGAKVIDIPWEKHFAKARNAALEAMSTDWVLVLDADEELDQSAGSTLPQIIENAGANAFSLSIREYLPRRDARFLPHPAKINLATMPRAKGALYYCESPHIRLFRLSSGLRFSGRIQETLISTDSGEPKPTFAGVAIHHFGALAGEEVSAARDRLQRELSSLRAEEEPDNPLAWLNLGILEYTRFQNHTQALACLQRAATLQPDLTQAWLHLASICQAVNRPAEALQLLQQAQNNTQLAAVCERLKGDAFEAVGQGGNARDAWQRTLDLGGPDPSVESKLGYLLVRLGEHVRGLAMVEQALAAVPLEPELHDRHLKAHIVCGDMAQAAEAAETLAAYIGEPGSFLRAASIRAQLQQWDRCQKLLSVGLLLFPRSKELRQAYEQLEQQRLESVANPLYAPDLGIPSRLVQTLMK